MTTSEKLRHLIDRASYENDSVFAMRMGVKQQTLNNWLLNKRTPEMPTLIRLARELGVTVDYLVDPAKEEVERALTEQDRIILGAARAMPFGEAMRRLVGAENGKSQPQPQQNTAGYNPSPPSGQARPKNQSHGNAG